MTEKDKINLVEILKKKYFDAGLGDPANPDTAKIGLTMPIQEFIGQLGEDDRLEAIIHTYNTVIDYYLELKGLKSYEVLEKVHRKIHVQNAEIIQKIKNVNKKEISCHKGCSHCCRTNVDITSLEAENIARNLLVSKRITKKHIDSMKKQLEYIDYYEDVSKAYNNMSKEVRECMFLVDNECSIYDIRPVVCRKHMSVSDPDLCDSIKHEKGQNERPFHIMSESLVSAMFNLYETGALPIMINKSLSEHNPTQFYEQINDSKT